MNFHTVLTYGIVAVGSGSTTAFLPLVTFFIDISRNCLSAAATASELGQILVLFA